MITITAICDQPLGHVQTNGTDADITTAPNRLE